MAITHISPAYATPIEAAKARLAKDLIFSPTPKQFKFLVIEEAEKFEKLKIEYVEELANILGVFFDRSWVPSRYFNWSPNLCNLFGGCVKFTSPSDPFKFVLFVASQGGTNVAILHHDDQGFISAQEFLSLVPVSVNSQQFLQELSSLKTSLVNDVTTNYTDLPNQPRANRGSVIRGRFSKYVSAPMTDWLDKQGVVLDAELIRFIHAFFKIVIPDVEHICPLCFKVSMPDLGFGIQYKNQLFPGLFYEIRLSPKKMGGQPQQKDMYITHRINNHGTTSYIQWRESSPLYPLDQRYTFSQDPSAIVTHIPYLSCNQQEIFEFLRTQKASQYFKNQTPNLPKNNLVIPLCQC